MGKSIDPMLKERAGSRVRVCFTDRLQNAMKWSCRSIDAGTMATVYIVSPINFNRLSEPLAP
jgi:hypothetical protein